VILKIVLEIGHEFNVHWRKSTNERRKAETEILTRLSEQSLELVSVVKEASRN
jgi:hypothetical protein